MAVLQKEALRGHDCKTASREVRRLMGCDEPLPNPWVFDGLTFERCPSFYVKSSWLTHAFEMYNWIEKGFLPFPGTYLDQPNKVIELVNYIDFLMGEKASAERARIRNQTSPKRSRGAFKA